MMFNEDGIEIEETGTFSMKPEADENHDSLLVFEGSQNLEPPALHMITCRSAEAGMIKAARENWRINGGMVFFMRNGTDVITVHDVITLESADNGRERLEALMLRIAERERLQAGKHYLGSKETIEARNMPEFFAKWFQSTDDKSATTGDNLLIWETPEVEAWLADALNHIDADDYHDWVKVGMAIKSQLGEAGFSVWDQWSAKSEKYSRESTMRKWQNIPSQSSVTIASVVWLAEQRRITRNGDDPSATKGLGIQFYDFSDVYADQSRT